jgi:hypothetical protein
LLGSHIRKESAQYFIDRCVVILCIIDNEVSDLFADAVLAEYRQKRSSNIKASMFAFDRSNCKQMLLSLTICIDVVRDDCD